MHIAEVVTIAKSLPLLRLNTYKSLILSYSADYRRILGKSIGEEFPETGGSSLRFVRSEQTAGPVPGGFFGRTVLSSLFPDK